ncbi:MAG: hypothetical protein ACLGXA_19090, partial [Acidobacteriota bacterium]
PWPWQAAIAADRPFVTNAAWPIFAGAPGNGIAARLGGMKRVGQRVFEVGQWSPVPGTGDPAGLLK